MRVVKTRIRRLLHWTWKSASTPSLRPIQLRWAATMRSGQAVSWSSARRRSSEFRVMRKAHSGICRSTTGESHRSHRPSFTCSLAMTVRHPVHQFTREKRRYTMSRSHSRRKNHWFHR